MLLNRIFYVDGVSTDLPIGHGDMGSGRIGENCYDSVWNARSLLESMEAMPTDLKKWHAPDTLEY